MAFFEPVTRRGFAPLGRRQARRRVALARQLGARGPIEWRPMVKNERALYQPHAPVDWLEGEVKEPIVIRAVFVRVRGKAELYSLAQKRGFDVFEVYKKGRRVRFPGPFKDVGPGTYELRFARGPKAFRPGSWLSIGVTTKRAWNVTRVDYEPHTAYGY